MKIAHIAPPWITIPPKNYGGTENVIYNLVEEQVAQGHDVTLIAPGDARTSAHLISFFSQSLLDAGVPWNAHLKAYYHCYKAVEYVNTRHFDIVHMHLSSSADMYLFPLTAQLLTPRVMTLHSCFPFDRVQTWTGDADTYFLPWMTTMPMVAISKSARAQVKHPLNFVDVIHHGLPMQDFPITSQQPGDYLVWLGRFVPEKGAHLAIEVAQKTHMPLILAGTVDKNISASVEYFENTIKPHIDDAQIKYIGPVDLKAKVDLLSKAHGFLNPIAWEEPFGMVMIEAMAVGCPVISFARGAAPEIIVPGKNGFLAHEVQGMSDRVTQLHTLDRQDVRKHIEQHFSVQVMAKKYVNLYHHIHTNAQRQPALRSHTFTPTPTRAAITKILAKPGYSSNISQTHSHQIQIAAKAESESL